MMSVGSLFTLVALLGAYKVHTLSSQKGLTSLLKQSGDARFIESGLSPSSAMLVRDIGLNSNPAQVVI